MTLYNFLDFCRNKNIQLSLKDQQLKVNAPDNTLTPEIIAQLKQYKPQIIQLLKDNQYHAAGQQIELSVIDRQGDLAVSSGQQQMWLLDSLQDLGDSYHFIRTLDFKGDLNIEALNKTFNRILDRHQSLRTVLYKKAGEIFQKVLPLAEFQIPLVDYASIADAEDKLTELEQALLNTQFKLDSDLMLRLQLVKLSDSHHKLIILLHHIASDGWSLGILINEFNTLYNGFCDNAAPSLADLPIQYIDYAQWQQKYLASEQYQSCLSYWQQKLAAVPEVHSLPIKHSRSNITQYSRRLYQQLLPVETCRKVKAISVERGVTLFMLLETLFATLLTKYSQSSDIIIGTTVANRDDELLSGLIGYFVNMLPLRNQIDPELSFADNLENNKQNILSAFKHQNIPFENIVNEVVNTRSNSYTPLVQICFSLQNNDMPDFKFNDLVCQVNEPKQHTTQFELHLSVDETSQGLVLNWQYAAELFDEKFVISLAESFGILTTNALNNKELPVKALEILTPQQKHQQLVEWNDTAADYPKDKCIHQLFEEQVELNPDAVAVVFEESQLTYGELNAQANQLAHYLIKERGITPDTLVGLCVARSLDMIVGIMAILKAGGAYVPLDPDYPAARLAYMLDDANLTTVLTQIQLQEKIPVNINQAVYLDSEEMLTQLQEHSTDNVVVDGLTSSHLAYVIYTSGSTGNPKGVLVEHGSATNYLSFAVENYCQNIRGSVVSTSLNFDATLTSLFSPLCCGKYIHLIQSGSTGLDELISVIIHARHSLLFKVTPAHLDVMKDSVKNISNSTLVHTFVIGGEELKLQTLKYWKKTLFSNAVFVNEFGPTEATVGCSVYEVSSSDDAAFLKSNAPIGKSIVNTQSYILNDSLLVLPIGSSGELYIGGAGLARGYLNQAELTSEKFIFNPFFDKNNPNSSERLYKTGDLVRYLPDGNLEFLGRLDHQVKIRGFRIELGEIENQLCRLADIDSAVVVAKANDLGDKQLVAYMQLSTQGLKRNTDDRRQSGFIQQLRAELSAALPEHMVPSGFVMVTEWPLTPNGKVDKNSLLKMQLLELNNSYASPENQLEQTLVGIWAELLGRDESKIGIHANFFDLGGNSLLSLQLQNRLAERTEFEIEMTDVFAYPSISSMSHYLLKTDADSDDSDAADDIPTTADIAVVGMSGKFPGAANVDEFWRNISAGIESIQFFDDEALIQNDISLELLNHKEFVKSCALLDDGKYFDAHYFSFTPREAELLDPQQRLMLECAADALEHAGYGDSSQARNIGVFVGTADSLYYKEHILGNPLISPEEQEMSYTGNSSAFVSTRISYKLNLTGPSINVLSACSTSLVSIHQAANSLLNSECEMALAGGGTISAHNPEGYLYMEGGISSEDGHCRPFDINASGTRPGSGGGMLLLKRLDKALADKDTIHAVIKGTAINNDGSNKVGYTAPSLQGQVDVIKKAHKRANVQASDIQYVETHGTGTKLGDPIEFNALKEVFAACEPQSCGLGTVKANVGHLDNGAGVTGVIKVIQALKHQKIPPNVNFTQPNALINITNSALYFSNQLLDWQPNSAVRYAGVSSFGIGGTNAHVVIGEHQNDYSQQGLRQTALITLSARSKNELCQAKSNLVGYLKNQSQHIADIAYTLQVGRTSHEYRAAIACDSASEAIEVLQNQNQNQCIQATQQPLLVFMFAGQGAQYVNMCRDLYLNEAVFKHGVDTCAEILNEVLSCDIRDILYPQQEDHALFEQAQSLINQTQFTQPVLFVIEYSLTKLLMSMGLKPDVMIGHSIGEYVAACIAGVFSLKDALKLVAARGQLTQGVSSGAMLSVSLPQVDMIALAKVKNVCLAAVNSAGNCVVSGTHSEIESIKAELEADGIVCKQLHTSHAFHSKMLNDILATFSEIVAAIELSEPKQPYVSNVTGEFVTPAQVTSPDYWVKHLRNTVRFAQGIEAIKADFDSNRDKVFIEVGPSTNLATFTRKAVINTGHKVVALTPHPKESVNDATRFHHALGQLWCYGVDINWRAYHQGNTGNRLPLPTYPYAKQAYWIAKKNHNHMVETQGQGLKHGCWYIPAWKQVFGPRAHAAQATDAATWLLFLDNSAIGESIEGALKQANQTVIKVHAANGYNRMSDHEYTIDSSTAAHYATLLNEVSASSQQFKIIHLASLNAGVAADKVCLDKFLSAQQTGTFSLLHIINNLAQSELLERASIDVITGNTEQLPGEAVINPLNSTIGGLFKVAPQEYPELNIKHIDINVSDVARVADNVVTELLCKNRPNSLVLRGNKRWEKKFEPQPLQQNDYSAFKLKDAGVYVITGGLGNIGLLLADYISRQYTGTKLVLLGRSQFPEQQQWSHILEQESSSALGVKVAKLQNIVKRGTQVLCLSADVSDLAQMRTAFAQIDQHLGKVDGFIHGAGALHGSIAPMAETQVKNFHDQYLSKVLGTLVLDELLQGRQYDFCVLMSSLASVLGGLGFSAYAGANAFLDAFAQLKHNSADDRWLSINWDGWNFEHDGNTAQPKNGLTEQNGGAALEQALHLGYVPQLIHSIGNLNTRLAQWIDNQQQTNTVEQSLHARPELNNEYIDPQTDMDRALIAIWQKYLGIKQIGIEDNFFELGGDSLLVSKVVNAIKNEFDLTATDMTISMFFNGPSIKQITNQIGDINKADSVQSKKAALLDEGKEIEEGEF